MPLFVATLCAIALLPWFTDLSTATAALGQAALSAVILPLAWIWGKGQRLPTLPSLATFPLFALGHTAAVALLPLGSGMAIGRVAHPSPFTQACMAALGTLGLVGCILPNSVLPAIESAGLATFLLAVAFHPKAGLLAAAVAGSGVGLAWGVVGQGGAGLVAGLAVAGTLAGLRPGWRHGLTAALALAVGGAAGTMVGGWGTPNPTPLLLAGAAGIAMAWTVGGPGRTGVAALTTLALAAPLATALWIMPVLALAGAWGARLRPRLAPFCGTDAANGQTMHSQRREPLPPRPLGAPPAATVSLEVAA